MTLDQLTEIPDSVPLIEAQAVVVSVTNPEQPFGGVVIQMPAEVPVLVNFGESGISEANEVTSVFGRVGDIEAQFSDYSAFYEPLSNVVTINSNYTVQPLDGTILVDCTSGPVMVNLPTATGSRRTLRIRKIDQTGNTAMITPVTGDFINTDPSLSLTDYRLGILIRDVTPHFWDLIVSPFIVFSDARNVFTDINTFAGIRIGPPITVTDDYVVQDTDFEILVDCSVLDKDISVTATMSNSSGQLLHIKKAPWDTTNHVVRILRNPAGTDLFDGSVSINMSDPGADALLHAGAPGYWDLFGPTLDDFVSLPLLLNKSRLMADGEFLLFNPDMNTFHAIRIRGSDNDSLYIQIDAGIP